MKYVFNNTAVAFCIKLVGAVRNVLGQMQILVINANQELKRVLKNSAT